jgi:hypothetical protein
VTPEGKAKARFRTQVKAKAAALGAELHLAGQGGSQYGTASVDYTGWLFKPGVMEWPRPFAVEVKRFDRPEHLTERQKATLRRFEQTGAAGFEVKSEDELQQFLAWMHAV